MKPIAFVILGAALCFAAIHLRARIRQAELPTVPASIEPQEGTVVEYWPNGEVRSERVYRDSRVAEAVYFASDGSVVYEMAAE